MTSGTMYYGTTSIKITFTSVVLILKAADGNSSLSVEDLESAEISALTPHSTI